jgi:hypothetical protein
MSANLLTSVRCVQVNTLAFTPGHCEDSDSEGRDGYDGNEASWQRCKVEAHIPGVEHTISKRWLKVVVHCAEVIPLATWHPQFPFLHALQTCHVFHA